MQGSIPGWGTKIPYTAQHSQKVKIKKKKKTQVVHIDWDMLSCCIHVVSGKSSGPFLRRFLIFFLPKTKGENSGSRFLSSLLTVGTSTAPPLLLLRLIWQHSSHCKVLTIHSALFLYQARGSLPLGQRVWKASRDVPAQSLSHPPDHTLNTQDLSFPVPPRICSGLFPASITHPDPRDQ